MRREVSCVLCQRSEETEVTGNLLRDGDVTAHYNCMLYSADLICQDSPQFGDLSGFRAEDVKLEVNRGRRLVCHVCEKRGATVGCEVARCKKSYHYPCAVEDGATPVDDETQGKYQIYCLRHYPGANNDGSTIGHDPGGSQPSTSNGGQPSKRTLSPTDVSEKRRRTEDSLQTSSGDSFRAEEPNTDMNIYAPIDSDIDDNENSEQQTHREAAEEPVVWPAGETLQQFGSELRCHTVFPGGPGDESPGDDEEDHTTLCPLEPASQEDNQNVLLPVKLCIRRLSYSQRSPEPQEPAGGAAEDFSPVQSSGPDQTERPGPSQESAPPRSFPMFPPPTAPLPPPSPERSIDPRSFWRGCNAAGCTRAVFQDFFSEMKDVAERICSDEASDEDFRLALSVSAASGKLAAYVAKQQEVPQQLPDDSTELRRKGQELQRASAAMAEVVAALRN